MVCCVGSGRNVPAWVNTAFTADLRCRRWQTTEAMNDDVGELRGVRARLIGFAALSDGKATPRDDPEDAAKDRADFTRLSQIRA